MLRASRRVLSAAPSSPAVVAASVPPRARNSVYPEVFAPRTAGREKRLLGNAFGLRNFGVNLTTLKRGAESGLLHRHARQDELVYVLAGRPTLVTLDDGGRRETELSPGMCAGFPAGGVAHHVVNRNDEPATYLEIGDRTAGDKVVYPEDDLAAELGADGNWVFTRKDGTPY